MPTSKVRPARATFRGRITATLGRRQARGARRAAPRGRGAQFRRIAPQSRLARNLREPRRASIRAQPGTPGGRRPRPGSGNSPSARACEVVVATPTKRHA